MASYEVAKTLELNLVSCASQTRVHTCMHKQVVQNYVLSDLIGTNLVLYGILNDPEDLS